MNSLKILHAVRSAITAIAELLVLSVDPLTLCMRLKGHSHCAPYGAAKQLLSAVHRRRTAQHGAVAARRRTALYGAARRRAAPHGAELLCCTSYILRAATRRTAPSLRGAVQRAV